MVLAAWAKYFHGARALFLLTRNIIGGIVLAGAWMFYAYYHRAHRKAHQQSSSIDSLTCPEYSILMAVNDIARKGGYYNVYSNCHGIRSKSKRTSP